ncbi:hypothetical protein AB6A40_007647 [Gnathostoma spinigerum]|uniref:Uncharacterized protein n=1 Tax=Gnathostoma spinigerum TaxID=75299 RepID=A0ABD6EV60_9BILA
MVIRRSVNPSTTVRMTVTVGTVAGKKPLIGSNADVKFSVQALQNEQLLARAAVNQRIEGDFDTASKWQSTSHHHMIAETNTRRAITNIR